MIFHKWKLVVYGLDGKHAFGIYGEKLLSLSQTVFRKSIFWPLNTIKILARQTKPKWTSLFRFRVIRRDDKSHLPQLYRKKRLVFFWKKK